MFTLWPGQGSSLDRPRPVTIRGGRHLSTPPPVDALGGSITGSYRRRGGRSRQLFAAHLGTSSQTAGWVTPVTARGGGEVVPVRSKVLVWKTDPINTRAGEELATGATSSAFPSETTAEVSSSPSIVRDNTGSVEDSKDQTRDSTAEALDGENRSEGSRASSTRKSHRRRVTWSGSVETREVERTTPSDIFSPDLHALVIAERLAAAADEPRVAEAARAVFAARREDAAAIRSLSASDGWSGSLEGVDDRSGTWNRREVLSMRETDELVRNLVSRGRADGQHQTRRDLYVLKDAYRAARRRMDDADAE